MTTPPRPLPLRTIGFLYGFAQVALLGAFIATAWSLPLTKVAGDSYEHYATRFSRDQIWNGIYAEYRTRLRDLAFFPPPADSARLAAWAGRVQDHLAFPAGVFLWRDSTVQVVAAPPELAAFVADLPRVVRPGTPIKQRMNADTVGELVLWHGQLKVDTLRAMAWAFQPAGDAAAWGVVSDLDDARLALAREILAYDGTNLLAARKWVGAVASGSKPAFRVFDGDNVVAATAGLDTSLAKYAEREGRVRFEYYAEGYNQLYIDLLKGSRLLIALLILEGALIVLLFFFHRWLKRAARAVQFADPVAPEAVA